MNLLLKNTLKKIKKSFGRFLSIAIIIALGISVFIGLREATAGMLYTADNYYDENNLMDFKIVSSYGLTDSDVDALKDLSDAYKVVPSYSLDVLSDGEAIRIHALEDDVNNVTLIDGKMPSNDNECVADYYTYKIGDVINFKTNENNNILSISQCKVVGTIKSVLYVRSEKGISSIGNGKLVSFVFVPKDVFTSEYYTEMYIIGEDSQDKNSYYDDYANQIEKLKNELEELKPIRETIRYEEILKEANDKIIEIKTELNSKIEEATNKLEDSKKVLDNSKSEIDNAKNNALKEFNYNNSQLNNNKNLIISNISALGISENNLDTYLNNLNNSINDLKNQLSLLDKDSKEYTDLNNQINLSENNYNNLLTAKNSLAEINNNLNLLNTNYNSFLKLMAEKEATLSDGYNKYYAGIDELKQSQAEAEQKILDAKEELNNIEKPVWYLLDRSDNSGYASYKEDIIKVDAVARVLPIFFIIIVILMISNTLTRMIEEERTEMGILQSNGFSRKSIIFNYLLYVFMAGLIGIGIGLTIGYSLIPKIIYGVFLSRYYAPKLITIVSPLPFSLVIITTLLVMTVVTIVACLKELKEVPAMLLRPKPPKNGKKVVFENSKFLWSKLSFMWKATIRNLFRYKKRIVMTILGVSGCTALLLTGMGINDSINTISKLQYENIVKYDSMYILDNNVTSIPNNLMKVFNDNGIVNPLLINQNAYTFSVDNKSLDVYLIVPSDTVAFNNYVTLNSVVNDKKVSIDDNGVIITKQMAQFLKVTVGDMISIRNSDNELYILYVTDIVENYVSHYIYMSSTYYKEIFDNDVTYNTIIADGRLDESIPLTDYNVLTVNYTQDIIKTFDSLVDGLNKIIIMIIVCACFLAFVVLYNLTIINVSERTREIATFKVLGFYDKEISTFVYRETIILTIMGIILGLFLGVYLHRFVIDTSETDSIMFLRSIKLSSYILSAVITIIFSYLVQLIISRTLKKIDMIDSLKSTE